MRNLVYEVIIKSNIELNEFVPSKVEVVNMPIPIEEGISIKFNKNNCKFKVSMTEQYMDENGIPMIFRSKYAIEKVKEYIKEKDLHV